MVKNPESERGQTLSYSVSISFQWLTSRHLLNYLNLALKKDFPKRSSVALCFWTTLLFLWRGVGKWNWRFVAKAVPLRHAEKLYTPRHCLRLATLTLRLTWFNPWLTPTLFWPCRDIVSQMMSCAGNEHNSRTPLNYKHLTGTLNCALNRMPWWFTWQTR